MIPDAAHNGWARSLAIVLAMLGIMSLLASCAAGGGTQPFAKSAPSNGGAGRIPPPIAIIAMNGLPAAQAGLLANALADEAGARDIAIVQGNFSDGYQLSGTFQPVNEGGGVRVLYQWLLTGNTGGELHRIDGQELVPAVGGDPWAGVDAVILKRIASITAESLSTRLAQLGFKVRQAGVMPPAHTFAMAGPNAEKEYDLETYYGPDSPFATASITPEELYTLSPEELDRRLSKAALDQAQDRLKSAGVSSVAELMGEGAGETAGEEAETGPTRLSSLASGARTDRENLATAQPSPDAKTEVAETGSEELQASEGKQIDKVALVGVTGSPGKGNDELFKAMRKVLRQAGWPVVSKPGKTTLSISGTVDLEPAQGGVQKVMLAWAVQLPTGKVLGTVRQANDVPAGSLNEGWGQTAGFAAEAAAEGIFSLVNQVRTQ